MKISTLTFTLLALFFCNLTKAQTISEIISNSEEKPANLVTIYDLDVLSYYELYDYNTELKQAVFKKSEEYQNKLTELKGIKAKMLKTTYYTKFEETFSSKYDIKRKGFKIRLSDNTSGVMLSCPTPKSIGGILLKALPIENETEIFGVNSEWLFFPLSEEAGLEIENDQKNIEIYFFFTPSGKEKSVFKTFNLLDVAWHNITNVNIKSDRVRIVLANKSSDKIYYDKSYIFKPTPTKK